MFRRLIEQLSKMIFEWWNEGRGRIQLWSLINVTGGERQIYILPLHHLSSESKFDRSLFIATVFNNRPCIFHRTRRQIFKCAAAELASKREFKADLKSAGAFGTSRPTPTLFRVFCVYIFAATFLLVVNGKGKRKKEKKDGLIISISKLYVLSFSPVIEINWDISIFLQFDPLRLSISLVSLFLYEITERRIIMLNFRGIIYISKCPTVNTSLFLSIL